MNLDFSGKKVIMRVDFNVPLNEHLAVSDDTRIRAAIPSINHIMNEGAALILMSHLGRPQKKKNDDGLARQEQLRTIWKVWGEDAFKENPRRWKKEAAAATGKETQLGRVITFTASNFVI